MILILNRIRAKVPVIMMGETGCGKTSLIKKLSELKNNGDSEQMKTFNIHAGITDEDIIEKIKEYDQEAKRMKFGKDLWVFLDEINTCKSMGLISELMCKRSCQGKKIDSNIVFIAACNPYRYLKGNNDAEIALNINLAVKENEKINDKQKKELEKESTKTKLVYTVNPLPHSLLNYVFNFGSLKEDDEHKYIENMIEKPFNEIFNLDDDKENKVIEKNEIKDEKQENEIKIDNKEDELKKIKNLAIDMVFEAQKFIRNNTDVSSVSLREIRKFIIFYKFFYGYLKFKKENCLNLNHIDKDFNYENLSKFQLQVYSINLSIFMCYYLRLTNKKLR